MSKRPENEDELQEREAIGVIRASRFVRKYSHSHNVITIDTIRKIHREILKMRGRKSRGDFGMKIWK